MKLIIINGPSGVGKTTLSKILVKENPLTVHLDIDVVRTLISDYHLHRERSSSLSFEFSLGLLRKALENNCDVVIDKVLFNHSDAPRQYLDEMIVIGREFNAEIHEFILTTDKQTIIERTKGSVFHQEGFLTQEKIEKFHDEMVVYARTRDFAHVIDTSGRSPAEILDEVHRVIQK